MSSAGDRRLAMRSARLRWVVVAVLLVAVGMVVVVLAARRDADGGDAELAPTVTPIRRSLVEAVVTHGNVAFPPTPDAVVTGGGTVTRLLVRPGDVIEPGDAIAEVNGRPVVAVAGEQAFWRSLAIGAEGGDVAFLESILVDTGHLPEPADTAFTQATANALTGWQADHGYTIPDGSFELNDMISAAWPARVGQVAAELGTPVPPGGVLLHLTSTTPAVVAALLPSDRTRVEAGLPVDVTVGATGAVQRGRLEVVADTPISTDDAERAYAVTISGLDLGGVPEGAEVTVSIVLREVRDVLAVPVAAIVSDDGGGPAVVVVDSGGGQQLTPVKLGIAQGAYVEVVDGLDGDERIRVGS